MKLNHDTKGGIVRIWIGTDALTMVMYPPGEFKWHVRIFFRRFLHKHFDMFFREHFVLSAMMKGRLMKAGISEKKIRIVGLDVKPFDIGCKTGEHDGFNVVYYAPPSNLKTIFGRVKNQKFKNWVYGVDIMEEVMDAVGYVNFIKVDGTADMSKIYPIADMVVRPNRSDGSNPPRMIMECLSLGIPYYWDPQFSPNAGDVIKAIRKEADAKKKNKHVL